MRKRLPDGRYVIISDIQAPYHDRRAIDALTKWISASKPDGILCVGDEADCPEPSRWVAGQAAEYAGTIEAGLTTTYDVLQQLTDALGKGKPFHLMRSNHTDRISNYLHRRAPALALTGWNDYRRIMGLDGHTPLLAGRTKALPITWHDEPYEFARGWHLAHGDEGPMNRTAGGTALGLARRWGSHGVVCGHTHRLGWQHDHKTLAGRITHPTTGVEVGHLMDMRKAGYLRAGSANWQAGFAIADIIRRRATVTTVPIERGRFVIDGQAWTA